MAAPQVARRVISSCSDSSPVCWNSRGIAGVEEGRKEGRQAGRQGAHVSRLSRYLERALCTRLHGAGSAVPRQYSAHQQLQAMHHSTARRPNKWGQTQTQHAASRNQAVSTEAECVSRVQPIPSRVRPHPPPQCTDPRKAAANRKPHAPWPWPAPISLLCSGRALGSSMVGRPASCLHGSVEKLTTYIYT